MKSEKTAAIDSGSISSTVNREDRYFVGQRKLRSLIDRLIGQGMPGHAYAFCGTAGMGKKLLANYFALRLLCTGKASQPCEKCMDCRLFRAGTHPDVHIIRPSNSKIAIDEIRAMQEHFSEQPIYGKRVCIIEEADKMNEAAQNCLLKTLEEPPSGMVLILTANAYDSMELTIRSRAIKLALGGYSKEELTAIIKDKAGKKPSDFLLEFSQGAPGAALKLLDSQTLEANRKRVLALLSIKGSAPDSTAIEDMWKHLSECYQEFPEAVDLFLGLLRDLLAVCSGVETKLINSDITDTIRKAAQFQNEDVLYSAIMRVDDLKKAVNDKLNDQLAVDALIAMIIPVFGR